MAVCDNGRVSEIEVVRGRLDATTRAALADRGTPADDVVCVVRDAAGELAGASVIRDTPFPGVRDRRLWTLELLGAAGDHSREVHAATWRALDAEYSGTGPEGLLLIPDRPDPALEWADPRTIFAGYTQDGRDARIAYFSAARTTPLPDWPPADPPYRVLPFAEQDAVSADDIVALWRREGILDEAEARRRIEELLLVAVGHGGELFGVSTAYLQHNEQLRLELWYIRAFVAGPYRRSTAATALAVGARDHLAAAYAAGDIRAPGILFEVENPGLKRAFPAAIWNEADVVFIGENARGDHVRVHYFSGASRT